MTDTITFSSDNWFKLHRTSVGGATDSATVYAKTGYDSTLVAQTSDACTWTDGGDYDWSNTITPSGNAAISTTGQHGTWWKTTYTANGSAEALVKRALNNANAYTSNSVTIIP